MKPLKKTFVFLTLFLSLFFALKGFAQSGLQPESAILATDAFYDGTFLFKGPDYVMWHKYKAIDNKQKVISVKTLGQNLTSVVTRIELYKGTSSSLQLVSTSSPITLNDSISTVFLDSLLVSPNDSVFFEINKNCKVR